MGLVAWLRDKTANTYKSGYSAGYLAGLERLAQRKTTDGDPYRSTPKTADEIRRARMKGHGAKMPKSAPAAFKSGYLAGDADGGAGRIYDDRVPST